MTSHVLRTSIGPDITKNEEHLRVVEEFPALAKDMLPMVALSDTFGSIVSTGIKMHQHGRYSHIMWIYDDEEHQEVRFASQDLLYRSVPLRKYLDQKHRLKIWFNPDWTPADRAAINGVIRARLDSSWWQRKYDILGIIGQLIHVRKLNNPLTNYCSEDVLRGLKVVEEGFEYVGEHPSPSDINRRCKVMPSMHCWGVWDPLLWKEVKDYNASLESAGLLDGEHLMTPSLAAGPGEGLRCSPKLAQEILRRKQADLQWINTARRFGIGEEPDVVKDLVKGINEEVMREVLLQRTEGRHSGALAVRALLDKRANDFEEMTQKEREEPVQFAPFAPLQILDDPTRPGTEPRTG